MTRRLQGARLAPFPDADEVHKAKRSLSHAARACNFTPLEMKLFGELRNVLDKSTEPINAYSSHAKNWNILATMDGDDFARFTDMTNLSSVVLQAHFLALDELLWPLSSFQLPKGRPRHLVSGFKSVCASPSYLGPEQEVAAQLIEWPISFLKRNSTPSTADTCITSGNSTPG
ncbi:hypothetical protein PRZ48_006926 [Zasmidium cellare]|uniref:Uncharacterized protein n=1 Tax=Zasmidium cellare TaxID=395010 RepID=A0ABR0EIX7_ZASCE|nr:hypothetical protein PRZ48_006926 [Zasmidium cellare]